MKKEIVKKKKKKKFKSVIIISLIIIVILILFIRSSRIGNIITDDPSLTPIEKFWAGFWFIFIVIIMVGSFIGYSYLPKKIRVNTGAWIKVIFTHLVWPSMFFVIILLGALTQQYPPASYPNGTFEDNMNKSFSIATQAMSNAFQKISMSLYNQGRDYPILWIIIIFVFIVIAIFLMKRAVKDYIIEGMDAQELIDSINDKDYEDIEKYENRRH